MGCLRSIIGWGSWYWRQSSLNCKTHDIEEGLDTVRTLTACSCRTLPWSRVIIPNKVSCRRWIIAGAGKVPDKKNTTGSGVLGWSFCILSNIFLWCCCIIWISFFFRTRVPRPDIRTGTPYIALTLSADAGLEEVDFASPAEISEPRDFRWAVLLC